MKIKLFFGLSFWVLLLALSCNRDQISFNAPTQLLRFSEDTVFLDTVYSQMRSETYAVKIYNNESNDVKIPRIYLEKGGNSFYKINVNGTAGTNFTNIPLRKKDSLFIFVEIAPVANATEAIVEDRIIIENPAGNQKINLYSVVQDAEYFIENKTNPNVIASNTTWTNNKVKVIFGNLTLNSGNTLTIEKGTKVYFHKNSGLKISKNANLIVNGELKNEVIFRGDRSDLRHDTVPNNWNEIYMDENATLKMNYAKVFGGENGITLFKSTAEIKNTIISLFSYYGIQAVKANLNAENLVFNNCGQADLGIFLGGNYSIVQSTLANYWDYDSTSPALSLFATNQLEAQTAPLNISIKNSILYNTVSEAVNFKQNSAALFNYNFQNCLMKYTNSKNAGFNFDANLNVVSCLKNEDPKFEIMYQSKQNLRVKSTSPARGKGNVTVANSVPLDIVKISRTVNPTLGAYQ